MGMDEMPEEPMEEDDGMGHSDSDQGESEGQGDRKNDVKVNAMTRRECVTLILTLTLIGGRRVDKERKCAVYWDVGLTEGRRREE